MTIKMSWAKEGDRLTCRWAELEENVPRNSNALPSNLSWLAGKPDAPYVTSMPRGFLRG